MGLETDLEEGDEKGQTTESGRRNWQPLFDLLDNPLVGCFQPIQGATNMITSVISKASLGVLQPQLSLAGDTASASKKTKAAVKTPTPPTTPTGSPVGTSGSTMGDLVSAAWDWIVK